MGHLIETTLHTADSMVAAHLATELARLEELDLALEEMDEARKRMAARRDVLRAEVARLRDAAQGPRVEPARAVVR